MTRLALIHLIREQTMQHLVPVLALKPASVFHLATPKTAARSANIVEAALLASCFRHNSAHMILP